MSIIRKEMLEEENGNDQASAAKARDQSKRKMII
tara:strand:+ start:976 stop:1077 length:102 start_codon:yes stop_codon:yes gene_type:complete